MTCTCGCADKPTIADIRHHRAVKAGTATLYKMREFKEAEKRYAQAKEKREDAHRNGRLGLSEDRECKDAAEALRDATKAVWTAYEVWDEAERKMLPPEADHG